MNKNKYELTQTLKLLEIQTQELFDLIEIVHERYSFEKKKVSDEQERANHFEQQNKNLYNTLIQQHETVFELFEQR